MRYAIALAGIAGTIFLAYALFGGELMFPRWKRWTLGLTGIALAAVLWVARPVLTDAPPDDSSTADEWP